MKAFVGAHMPAKSSARAAAAQSDFMLRVRYEPHMSLDVLEDESCPPAGNLWYHVGIPYWSPISLTTLQCEEVGQRVVDSGSRTVLELSPVYSGDGEERTPCTYTMCSLLSSLHRGRPITMHFHRIYVSDERVATWDACPVLVERNAMWEPGALWHGAQAESTKPVRQRAATPTAVASSDSEAGSVHSSSSSDGLGVRQEWPRHARGLLKKGNSSASSSSSDCDSSPARNDPEGIEEEEDRELSPETASSETLLEEVDDPSEPRVCAKPKAASRRQANLCFTVVDVDGTEVGEIVYNQKADSFDAHCWLHDNCPNLNRKLHAWQGKARQAQGRPLGLLVAWLLAGGSVNCEQHEDMKKGKYCTQAGENPVSFEKRSNARAWIEMQAGWHEFLRTIAPAGERPPRAGEEREPRALA